MRAFFRCNALQPLSTDCEGLTLVTTASEEVVVGAKYRDDKNSQLWGLVPMVINFIDLLPSGGHAQLIGNGIAIAVFTAMVGAGWLPDVRRRRRVRGGRSDA